MLLQIADFKSRQNVKESWLLLIVQVRMRKIFCQIYQVT